MRLTWNEVKTRASEFSKTWADAHYEKGETQSFYNDFFHVFGAERKAVGSFERAVKKMDGRQGFIDLFWPGVLLVEQKSQGRALGPAEFQAMDYIHALKPSEVPRYVLLSDFQTFRLIDLEKREELEFPLHDLHKHVQKFGFIMGVERRTFKDQDPVNIEAAELVGKLHDGLEDSGFVGEDLEVFLVRIVFCLFADDTGVFPTRDMFLRWLTESTSEDGSDLGPKLRQMFEVLNTPDGQNGTENKRGSNLPEAMADFPYINGSLFAGHTNTPSFTSAMRDDLIEACIFDWTPISPAIFGSLFQSVMNRDERRATGAHYTTEKNIMKVIEPLFLDELRTELAAAKTNKTASRRNTKLDALSDKLGSLKLFDPACGCGNFLIIAYRELRRLEIELLKVRLGQNLELDARVLSNIDVDQFYGIEIGEFAAKIAETAMWMMDHIMNNELSLAFGQNFARIPLDKAATIVCGDALEVDWEDVLPAAECAYVLGNPPFIGAKYQTKAQRAQVKRIADRAGAGGTLDFVAAWFLKAAEYAGKGSANPPHIAFVSTNSITQGEQVAQLWPPLFDRYKMEIAFAHRTFEWGSDARGKAHVHVVIVGLSRRENVRAEKRLLSYDGIEDEAREAVYDWISPYLFGVSNASDRHVVVKSTRRPLNNASPVVVGSKPIDGAYLILNNAKEKSDFLNNNEIAETFVRPYIGSKEYIQGTERWILALQDISPAKIRKSPKTLQRLDQVRRYRNAEISHKNRTQQPPFKTGISAKALADTPASFHLTVVPEKPFMVIPETSSENRYYAPIGWLEPPIVPSNKLKIVEGAEIYEFSILTSLMHMAWMRTITGRMKSDYMYSIGVVYNTFPRPAVDDAARAKLTKTGQAILDARAEWPDSTLADLYEANAMKPNLRRAHQANDRAVDRLYRRKPFESERERVEHLFALYEALQSPIEAAAAPKPKRRKRVVKTS